MHCWQQLDKPAVLTDDLFNKLWLEVNTDVGVSAFPATVVAPGVKVTVESPKQTSVIFNLNVPTGIGSPVTVIPVVNAWVPPVANTAVVPVATLSNFIASDTLYVLII